MLYAQEQAWHAGAMRAGHPGAIDHVMDRGARRQDIFVNDDVRLCAFEQRQFMRPNIVGGDVRSL